MDLLSVLFSGEDPLLNAMSQVQYDNVLRSELGNTIIKSRTFEELPKNLPLSMHGFEQIYNLELKSGLHDFHELVVPFEPSFFKLSLSQLDSSSDF